MEKCIAKRNLYTHFCSWTTDEGHELQIKENKKVLKIANIL